MKTTKITFIFVSAIIITACSSTKKSATSTTSSATTSTNTRSTSPFLFANPANGIYAPGNEELTAIQAQYKDVTLDKLKEGHAIYTQGACTNCHGAKNIYDLAEVQWKSILDDMAQKAEISDAQKDAVYKYVLSIKAMQPK
jgi:glutaredoxin